MPTRHLTERQKEAKANKLEIEIVELIQQSSGKTAEEQLRIIRKLIEPRKRSYAVYSGREFNYRQALERYKAQQWKPEGRIGD